MSRKGNPWDNAACESFMKTLKYEEVLRNEYRDLREAKASIGGFLEKVYNEKRLREIYPSDGDASVVAGIPAHRLDEFPAGYSSAGCSPALSASASPTGSDYGVKSSCWSIAFQRPANSVLTGCLSSGGKRTAT
jgi:hypothetical protein